MISSLLASSLIQTDPVGPAGREGFFMSDGKLQFPEWQAPPQEVILEFDREKMLKKIEGVESTIFERIRELSVGSDGRVELEALNDALSILRILNRDGLGITDGK
jgi:hypothetical protein